MLRLIGPLPCITCIWVEIFNHARAVILIARGFLPRERRFNALLATSLSTNRAKLSGKPLAASLKRLARDTISTPDAILILRTPDHTDAPQFQSWQIHDCWELSSMMIWILVKQPIVGENEESEGDVAEPSSDDSLTSEISDAAESVPSVQGE